MTPEKNNSVKKEVNKIKSAVAKNVFRVGLAGSILLGSSACVPTEAIFTTPTPEVSPLPSDFTRTPDLLPTEAPIELIPTIDNSSIQKLDSALSTEIEEFVDYEWVTSLLDKLGDEYYYDDKYSSIWFKKNDNDGIPEIGVPVLIFCFKDSVTFQVGAEGGRETVRHARYENVKVSVDGNLSLVDNYYEKNYVFSEVNGSWWEKNE